MNEAKCFKILENKNSHTTSYSMLKSNLQLQYLHFQLVIFCIQLATLTKLSCLLWHQNRFGSKIIYPLPVTDIWHFRLRRWKCISVWHTINLFIKWYFIRSTVAQIYKIVFSKEIIFFLKKTWLLRLSNFPKTVKIDNLKRTVLIFKALCFTNMHDRSYDKDTYEVLHTVLPTFSPHKRLLLENRGNFEIDYDCNFKGLLFIEC